MAPLDVFQETLMVPVPQEPGVAVRPVGVVGAVGFTVTAVQGVLALQLFPSFDSTMVPLASPAELLSAQARIYQVPAEAKVMDFEVTAFPPFAASALIPVTE